MGEMLPPAIEAVGDRRAGWAARLVVRSEHEVIDDQLRAAAEQVRQARLAILGAEPIVLFDPNPGKRLPALGKIVAGASQLLFGAEQLQPRLQPFRPAGDGMCRHLSASATASFIRACNAQKSLTPRPASRSCSTARCEAQPPPKSRAPDSLSILLWVSTRRVRLPSGESS